MIKRKKKTCKQCNTEQILFGKGLCHSCYRTTQRKPKPVSDSMKKTLEAYSPKRKRFLALRPNCEVRLDCCTKVSTCIHHMKGKHSKEMYLNESYWMASCIPCNNKIETLGELAYTMGLRIRHNTK